MMHRVEMEIFPDLQIFKYLQEVQSPSRSLWHPTWMHSRVKSSISSSRHRVWVHPIYHQSNIRSHHMRAGSGWQTALYQRWITPSHGQYMTAVCGRLVGMARAVLLNAMIPPVKHGSRTHYRSPRLSNIRWMVVTVWMGMDMKSWCSSRTPLLQAHYSDSTSQTEHGILFPYLNITRGLPRKDAGRRILSLSTMSPPTSIQDRNATCATSPVELPSKVAGMSKICGSMIRQTLKMDPLSILGITQ